MPAYLETLRLDIIDARFTMITSEWDVAPLQPDAFSRLYLGTTGTGTIRGDSGNREIIRGDEVLIPAGTRFSPATSPGFGHFWVHFTTKVFGGIELFDIMAPAAEYRSEDIQLRETLYKRLLKISQNRPLQGSFEAQSIVRLLLSPFIDTQSPSDLVDTSSYARFAAALGFIDKHLSTNISVPDLAALEGICTNYFSNLFSNTFGVPPRTYISRKRIERAQLLLWTTTEPLKRVASLSGFKDVSYFSRQFKSITGVTPGYYRRRRDTMHPSTSE